MRKSILMFSVLATALVFSSCSSNEPANTGENTGLQGQTKYMAVTISTGSELPMGTRAEGDGDNPTPSGNYEDGEISESAVETLDFYFFYNDGTAATVKSDGTNHHTGTVETTNTSEGENITNAIKAVVVISTQDGDAIPDQVVAVINRETSASYVGLSLQELQEELTNGKSDNGFVMSNSVYVSGNTLQCGVPIAGHLFSSETEATNNPVTIYVERALAKVRLKSSIDEVTLSDGTKAYNPNKPNSDSSEGGDNSKTEEYDGKQIYVKFLGWNTTTVSTQNLLLKSINPTWSPKWTWYTADYHRSFWAQNPSGNSIEHFKFEPENGETAETVNSANRFTNFDGTAYTYLKENAGINDLGANPDPRSKVIIAAQLVDEDGNPVEMAEWAFQRMTVDNLKVAFANAATLYTKETVTTGEGENPVTQTVLTQITPEDIELKTATAAGFTKDNRRYLVYATLTETAASKTWFKEPRLEATAISETEIKDILFGLGGAKVWKGGRTYYYFDIRHLAYGNTSAEFGQYGVVRNHVYDTTVNSLFGLGTPVYDPYEVIIPEKPSDDDTFIAAQIKILSWRIVKFGVNLEW